MKSWERTLIHADATLRQALEAIDVTGSGIALLVDADRKLLGVLSDGDIRRALIRGAALADAAMTAANTHPRCVVDDLDRAGILATLR